MKANLILARTAFGCAALFVNKAVVQDATSAEEVNKLADAASKLSAALGVELTDYTLTSADTCWCKGWSDSAPNWSKLAEQLESAPATDVVRVRVWDAYDVEAEVVKPNTHTLEISDQRQVNGQARLILALQDGNPEQLLDVLLEVQANPFNPEQFVPAALVHVDMDDPVVSILAFEDKLLVRPNTGVQIAHEVVVIDGKPEDVVVIR